MLVFREIFGSLRLLFFGYVTYLKFLSKALYAFINYFDMVNCIKRKYTARIVGKPKKGLNGLYVAVNTSLKIFRYCNLFSDGALHIRASDVPYMANDLPIFKSF